MTGSLPMIDSAPVTSDANAVAERVVLHTRVVTGRGGGPEKTILNSPRFLAGTGYRAICAYMHPPGDDGVEVLAARATEAQADLRTITDRGPFDTQVIRELLRLCRQENVAIWHGHDYKSNALGLLLRRWHPMRLVTTVHGWGVLGGRTPLYYAIDRFCLKRYDQVVCVSEDLHEQCLRLGISAERCTLIDNAIDVDQFRRTRDKQQARQSLGLPEKPLVFGSVGRLSGEKGFDYLIQAFSQVVGAGVDAHLVIAGDGDQHARLAQLIQALNLEDRVQLMGYVQDPRQLYQALDVYVLSSLREGLPNVLLEAMALEVPVLSTRVAGIPRLISEGMNGLVVPPASSSVLAEGMIRLAQDSDLRQALAKAGRETIEKRFSFAVRMARMRAVYDGLSEATR